jgi:organic hydroperoxide reductase OsmC/OhrA
VADFTVELRTIPGTKAAVGRAGNHTIVIDRPEGRAGGMGLGFNGGQLLAIAIGGCLCNDLHYAAAKRGVTIRDLSVAVTVAMSGEPLIADGAEIAVEATAEEPTADVGALIEAAFAGSAVSNSMMRGLPVRLTRRGGS